MAVLSKSDRERVRNAVASAEAGTSAEIRVHLQPRAGPDVRRTAEELFVRIGMTRTEARNGTLIVVASHDRQFAIIGDEGIDARVGSEFWRSTAEAMEARFRHGDFVGAIEAGVAALGKVLAEHFPRRPDDVNELSDDISEE